MRNCKRIGCDTKVTSSRNKYCSMTCSAVVNNTKFPKRKRKDYGHYRCAYCNKKHIKRSNTMNKYCDNVCQQKHRKHIRNEKIERDEHMGKSVGKKRLIMSYLKDTNQWYCNQCGALAEESPMEFHHIDGNRYNNRLSNSMVLCRNCHGRTQNFKAKNKGNYSYL